MEPSQLEPHHCPAATSIGAGAGAIPSAESAPTGSWPVGLLERPRVLANGMEVSVHACTRSMAREVKYIFPHLKPRVVVQHQQHQQHRSAGSAGSASSGKESGGGEDGGDAVLIVPTIQKSRVDTVRFGVQAEEEKDRCLEYVRACLCRSLVGTTGGQGIGIASPQAHLIQHTTLSPLPPLQFADFAKPLCQELRALGHWADYIDPCSGLPVRTFIGGGKGWVLVGRSIESP